jgi:hypothetical protein
MNETMNGGMPEPQLAAGTIVQEDCVERYKPTKQEVLRNYRIEIEFLSVGCVIRVGCKSVPFSTVKEGMEALNAYVKDPIGLRKIWEERFAKEE